MTRLFHTLLLWLLMAALPVQGMAAAIGTSCAPIEHAGIPMLAPSGLQQDHGATHHHDEYHSAPAVQHLHGSDAGSAPDHAPAGKHKQSTCGVCASCCTGAVAPPSAPVPMPEHDHAGVALPPFHLPVTGFVPAGLERPPRPFPA